MSDMNLFVAEDIERAEKIIHKYLSEKGIITKLWISLHMREPVPGEWWCNYSFRKDAPTYRKGELGQDYNRMLDIYPKTRVCGVIKNITNEYKRWISLREAKRNFNAEVNQALCMRRYLLEVEVDRCAMFCEWDEDIKESTGDGDFWLCLDHNEFLVRARFQYQDEIHVYRKTYLPDKLSLGNVVRDLDEVYLKWAIKVGVPEKQLAKGD